MIYHAKFSEDETFRYEWACNAAHKSVELLKPRVLNFIMLNPSTADTHTLDPTVTRCLNRAKTIGFNILVVTNLFALRATDPKQLYENKNPIGEENDATLLKIAKNSDMVIVGWGLHGKLLGRAKYVENLLIDNGIDLYALDITKAGFPKHPLYVSYTRQPEIYRKGKNNLTNSESSGSVSVTSQNTKGHIMTQTSPSTRAAALERAIEIMEDEKQKLDALNANHAIAQVIYWKAYHASAVANLTLSEHEKQEEIYRKEVDADLELHKIKIEVLKATAAYDLAHLKARRINRSE